MADDSERIQIPLTPEQQALIKRMSGQHAEVLELEQDSSAEAPEGGGAPRFLWRLSTATGIPRQKWKVDPPKPKK